MARTLPDQVTLDLGLDEADDPAALRRHVAKALKRPVDEVPEVHLRRRSIDARKGKVRFHLLVDFEEDPPPEELGAPDPREVSGPAHVVVVGDGPAGLFCAYALARHGIRATVLDRGKQVQPRRRDLALLNRGERIDPESNYCFGEGGAGTYSDGKLYTRADKRGPVRDVMEILVRNGATPKILVDARPHIGSNKLPKVVTEIRERLASAGVDFRFEAKVVGLLSEGRGNERRATGVRLADGSEITGDAVVLATGHSARDVYSFLHEAGVVLVPKPFALGVRIEHPQPFINRQQYGRAAGHPKLPAAYYRVAHTVEERGVFSFCMCPGGWIVPASTEPDGLVVNGMSLSRRDSPFANSGLVVAVEPSDWEAAGFGGPMGGVELQRTIERAALVAGGGAIRAPATRASDFRARRASSTVPDGSYLPGYTPTDLAPVLDAAGLPFAHRLREALAAFERRMPGYAGEEALLVGVETRTSSPVRIPRDPTSLESPDMAGLYPAGEGGGYAGGIVSAALDGMNIAERIAGRLAEAGRLPLARTSGVG
ncbi:MAG: NAD(P)/FAD-dependent oxidoreductase [Polyangiales bacterium]